FREELYIVDYQYIDQLVKMDKIIDRIVPAMVHELVDEFLGTNIEHYFIRVHPFNLISNGLSQVGLTQSDAPVDDKGVEGTRPGLLGNGLPGTAGHPVAIP